MFDGRYQDVDSARPALGTLDAAGNEIGHADGGRGGLTVKMLHSTFWQNHATWCGGAYRGANLWPLKVTVEDTQFLDGTAFIGHVMVTTNYCNVS